MIYVLYLRIKLSILSLPVKLFFVATLISAAAGAVKGQPFPADVNRELVCFVYHRFDDTRYPSTNIASSVFREQLEYLAENDYLVMSLGQAIQWLKTGNTEQQKAIVLTVDDGYRSFYSHAFPLLQEYGYRATVFINTVHVGDRDYMTWEQLGEISNAGIEIGCHSHRHEHFVNLHEEEMRSLFRHDLQLFRETIKEKLNMLPRLYSYPYGEFNEELKRLLKNNGFIAACAQNSGVANLNSDLFAIPRYPMGGPYGTLVGFMEKASMHALPVRWEKPESSIMKANPPKLSVCLEPGKVDIEQLQCFIHGDKECIVMFEDSEEGPVVRIQSLNQLSNRRTLYTLTAPLLDGSGWCWYSKLWINTEVEE
jgi:peptidoglycan/xylan/chitin deacetylase (PgdA/CDA1 family)